MASRPNAVDRELLVKGLDRLAQCDSQYKSSKEPRLLVELMLIQLCRINAQCPNAAVAASERLGKKKVLT